MTNSSEHDPRFKSYLSNAFTRTGEALQKVSTRKVRCDAAMFAFSVAICTGAIAATVTVTSDDIHHRRLLELALQAGDYAQALELAKQVDTDTLKRSTVFAGITLEAATGIVFGVKEMWGKRVDKTIPLSTWALPGLGRLLITTGQHLKHLPLPDPGRW